MSEVVPLETQTSTFYDRKHVSLHVPSLLALSAYHGRYILDEFNLSNVDVDNEGLTFRSKLDQRIMDWLESFYLDMRADVPRKYVDAFWLKMCLAKNLRSLTLFFRGISFPDMSWYSIDILFSYLDHLRVPATISDREAEDFAKMLGFLLLCILRLCLMAGNNVLARFNHQLILVVRKIKVNQLLLKLALSKVLLAFPFKHEREFLLSLGAEVNLVSLIPDHQGSHPLIVACGTGNYDYAKKACMTETGTFDIEGYSVSCHNPNPYDEEFYSPLSAAIEANDIDMVNLLIELGVYTSGSRSCTIAARRRDIGYGLSRGHFEIVKLIISQSPSVLCPSLFEYANDVTKAKFLLEEAHCPNTTGFLRYHDNDDVMTYLIENGSDPNKVFIPLAKSTSGLFRPLLSTLSVCLTADGFLGSRTIFKPIMTAVLNRDGPLLRLLIGSYLNCGDIGDVSILSCAARSPNIGISDLLIRAGADARTLLMLFCDIMTPRDDVPRNVRYLLWLLKQHGIRERLQLTCEEAFLLMDTHIPYPVHLSYPLLRNIPNAHPQGADQHVDQQ